MLLLERAVAWISALLTRLTWRDTLSAVDLSAAEVAQAIRVMVVRGAPAIGITAAYGVVLAAKARYAQDPNRIGET
jgi:methylthioribose-1-phosphate isomerase